MHEIQETWQPIQKRGKGIPQSNGRGKTQGFSFTESYGWKTENSGVGAGAGGLCLQRKF